jgi:transcription-repair coupling factor (superfamily II helicase)
MNTLSFPALQKRITTGAAAHILKVCREGKFPLEIDACEGAFTALLMALLYKAQKGTCLAVVSSDTEAGLLARDLETAGAQAAILPWWGTMPYKEMSPLSAVFGERVGILAALVSNSQGILIVPERAFLTPLPPPEYIKSLLFAIKPGGAIDTSALAGRLASYGYTRVPRVQVHGEFALRGEVLDILMGGDEEAYRILFDFDKVESIKRFNPVDQGGQEKVNELIIRPLKEVIWTDERIETLSKNLEAISFQDGDKGQRLLEELMARKSVPGEEMYFPLAFDQPASLVDYLSPEAVCFFLDRERLEYAQESLDKEYKSLYAHAWRVPIKEMPLAKCLPPPEKILLSFAEESKRCARRISFMTLKGGGEEGATRVTAACDPPRSFFGNVDYLKEEFSALIKQGWDLVVAAESDVQAARIAELLQDEKASVIAAPLSAGFALPDIKFMLIQENEIFGRRRRAPKSLKTVRSAAIDTFVELNPGDYVVHVNYGIGLFKGIERIKALGHERDYIKIEYLDEETVFVPIEQVNLVQRYIGNEGSPPRLDKLGSKSWENRKGRVKKSVEDIAERLLALYSKRKQAVGYAYPRDTEWQTMFEASFPFEETEDQLRCVEEIKTDMESPHPMDRLVCGDVGYGKTEVAVRACFEAIMGGKQKTAYEIGRAHV